MKHKRRHISTEERKRIDANKKAWERNLIESLQFSNLKTASFKKRIAVVFQNNGAAHDKSSSLHPEIRKGFATMGFKKHEKSRTALMQLLIHLDEKKCKKLLENRECLIALVNIARQSTYFVREIADWKKTSHNPYKQLSSLLRHLFCHFTVPLFLDAAWITHNNENQQRWLRQIGMGISIRQLNNMPIVLTKKMAHQFGTAPASLAVNEAIRWAQVIAKGGTELLARFIYQSPIGRNNFTNENFWDSVINLMINAPLFDFEKIDEIVDYLNAKKTEDTNYTIKGRTIASIIRNSDSWHIQINAQRNRGGKLMWGKSGICEFETKEGPENKKIIYEVVELLSSNELIAEGKKMGHCVASYSSSCFHKRCAIFSIRKKDDYNNEETLATIEVSLKPKRVVQAKAKFNRGINSKAQQVLKLWTAREEITIPKWVLNN